MFFKCSFLPVSAAMKPEKDVCLDVVGGLGGDCTVVARCLVAVAF